MDINKHLNAKLEKRVLELFEKGHSSDDLNNINIKKFILDKLKQYQILHTFNMITAMKNNNIVIDGSFTGTGKTYTSSAAFAQLGFIPFVICPISIISKWKSVLEMFGVEYVAVVNYESIRSLKYRDPTGKKNIDCPYIRKEDGQYVWDFSSHPRAKDIILVFDEVHRCKKPQSLNGKLLMSARKMRTLMLSATLCDTTKDFGIFGMMLGFYSKLSQGKSWMESIIREDKNQYGRKVNTLHKHLFPGKGSMMSLEDLGESFPKNQISVDCYNLHPDSVIKINRYYDKIVAEKTIPNKLAEINHMRQMIENFKVEVIFDILADYHEQGRSVVVFVNYTSTYEMLEKLLKKNDIHYAELNGKQDSEERQNNINMFQNNEVRVMLSMIQVGSNSISLDDLTGRFPRVSIISPSYSAIELTQTLGRIYRSSCRSPCLQKIVYCADTCEEDIAKVLESKKDVLDRLTDDDLDVETVYEAKKVNKLAKTENGDVKGIKEERGAKHSQNTQTYDRRSVRNDKFGRIDRRTVIANHDNRYVKHDVKYYDNNHRGRDKSTYNANRNGSNRDLVSFKTRDIRREKDAAAEKLRRRHSIDGNEKDAVRDTTVKVARKKKQGEDLFLIG